MRLLLALLLFSSSLFSQGPGITLYKQVKYSVGINKAFLVDEEGGGIGFNFGVDGIFKPWKSIFDLEIGIHCLERTSRNHKSLLLSSPLLIGLTKGDNIQFSLKAGGNAMVHIWSFNVNLSSMLAAGISWGYSDNLRLNIEARSIKNVIGGHLNQDRPSHFGNAYLPSYGRVVSINFGIIRLLNK